MNGIRGEMANTPADLKRCLRLRREAASKAPGAEWEDRVWHLFYRLGFTAINRDRQCHLLLKEGHEKQVDVLARDENNVFAVQCTSSEGPGPVRAKSLLEWFEGYHDQVRNAICKQWEPLRVCLVAAVSSQEKAEPDERLAVAVRAKNIFLWSAADLRYMEQLADQIGPLARYQIYSVLFAGKQQKSLARPYPALMGKISGRTYYSFLMSARDLLQYAHIHHRELLSLSEMPGAYQRMLKAAKLAQIRKYIDTQGGFFPNSVIINFTKPPTWTRQHKEGDVEQGLLTLPAYYGSAWIIDGQHRLYGAAQAHTEITLPVIALQNMQISEQAALFVDINKKQTKVPPELLWDLYSDIYEGSSDPRQARLYTVAETAKRLARREPFRGRIDIPSVPKPAQPALKLATVCETLRGYLHWKNIPRGDDPQHGPDEAARLIGAYYDQLREVWPDDWRAETNGVLLSNNGFGVLIMVFDDILRHLVNEGRDRILLQNALPELRTTLRGTYVMPIVEYLKHTDSFADRVRTANSRGLQGVAATDLDLHLATKVDCFDPPRLQKQGVVALARPTRAPGQDAPEKCTRFEGILREYILKKLKEQFGPAWWKHAIPGGVKKAADEMWQKEVKHKPYLQREPATSDPNEYKFSKLGLEHLRQVVLCGTNWEPVFEADFADQTNFLKYLSLLVPARDARAHQRSPDQQEIADAVSGLLWFSRVLAEPSINPYL